jgi:hypothetical protein
MGTANIRFGDPTLISRVIQTSADVTVSSYGDSGRKVPYTEGLSTFTLAIVTPHCMTIQ